MKRYRWFALAAVLLALAFGVGSNWERVSDLVGSLMYGDARGRNASASNGGNDRAQRLSGVSLQPRNPGATLVTNNKSDQHAAIEALNNDPKAQLAMWNERYARAQEIYDNYRKQTAYPFESRPAREHSDQMYPNQPVVEDQKLKNPGQKPSQNVRLRTSQERVYVAGNETVAFTVTALDSEGNALPIAFTRAIARDPPRDGKPSQRSAINFPFNDDGSNGDTTAGDLTYSARLSPATQGFAGHSGAIRIELNMQVGEQTGFVYFDVFYTPEPPAVWTGKIRETVERGSLNFYLAADVRIAGRYVVTGRIDDAKGQPFALISFNDELTAGPKEIKLNLFGKLLVDEKPAFPLTLRDVDGFLLIPDTDPDRALMPRLPGRQLVTRSYALTLFSEAEWDSEERRRYLEEYGRDVETARAHLEHVRRSMKP
jgi:hypothetical protein